MMSTMRSWIRPFRRWTRVVAYTFMAVGGLASTVWPSPSVRNVTYPLAALLYLWAILLIIGGITAAVGAATGRWIGEYVGLWPLISTFAVYGIASLSSGRVTSIAGGLVLSSFAFFLLARWRDVADVRREAGRYATGHERGGDVG